MLTIAALPRLTARRPLLATLLLLLTAGAGAQDSPAGFGPKTQTDNPCLNEVSKFEQTIGLLRQTQGNKAAAEIKERLLPAKLENEILFRDGYCGLAKHLREKKLIDKS